jgi:hypothetical protein
MNLEFVVENRSVTATSQSIFISNTKSIIYFAVMMYALFGGFLPPGNRTVLCKPLCCVSICKICLSQLNSFTLTRDISYKL